MMFCTLVGSFSLYFNSFQYCMNWVYRHACQPSPWVFFAFSFFSAHLGSIRWMATPPILSTPLHALVDRPVASSLTFFLFPTDFGPVAASLTAGFFEPLARLFVRLNRFRCCIAFISFVRSFDLVHLVSFVIAAFQHPPFLSP